MSETMCCDDAAELRLMIDGNCHLLAVRKASRRLSQFYDQALAPHGLTSGQLALMAMILRHGRSTVQMLAGALAMDQSAVSRGIAPLERVGLVVSRSDDGDRRKRIVMLTDKGCQRLRTAAIAWKGAREQLEARNSGLDLNVLAAELDRLAFSVP